MTLLQGEEIALKEYRLSPPAYLGMTWDRRAWDGRIQGGIVWEEGDYEVDEGLVELEEREVTGPGVILFSRMDLAGQTGLLK